MKKYKYKPKITTTKPIDIEKRISDLMSKDPTKEANKIASRGRPKKSVREIKREVNKLVKEANRRLQRLEKSGKAYQSSAYRTLQEEKGQKPRFKVKGSSRQSLEQQLKELKSFINKKSSTLKGTKDIAKKQKEELEKQGITFKDEAEEKEFFEMFGDYMSKSKQRGKKQYNSYQIKSLMYDSYTKQQDKYGFVDKQRLYNNVRAKVRYWEQQQEEEENDIFDRLTEKRKEYQKRTRPTRTR